MSSVMSASPRPLRRTVTRFVDRMLNRVLRPLGWWTHGSDDISRRWFHRDTEGTKAQPKPFRRNQIHCIAIENSWFTPRWGLALQFRMEHDSEGTFQLFYSIPFILAQWITLDIGYLDWVERRTGKYGNATFGFAIDGHGIKGRWFINDMDSSGNRGKAKEFYWEWNNLRGKVTYTRVVNDTQVVMFEQPAFRQRPASIHQMTLTHTTCTWHYSNPLVRSVTRPYWDIVVENPPSISGKGENGWDQGDTGITGCSCDGNGTVGDAIAHYVRLVEKDRQRHD